MNAERKLHLLPSNLHQNLLYSIFQSNNVHHKVTHEHRCEIENPIVSQNPNLQKVNQIESIIVKISWTVKISCTYGHKGVIWVVPGLFISVFNVVRAMLCPFKG